MHVGDTTTAEVGSARGRRRGRHPAGGFTLAELMVVIAIIAVVSVIAFFGFARPSAASQATSISRDLYFALHRARLQATTQGQQVRVWLCRSADSTCGSTGIWFTQFTTSLGTWTPTGSVGAGEQGVITRRNAWVSEIKDNGGATLGATVNASVTFMPDGSTATGASEGRLITVVDNNGATGFSIQIFAATGLVRLWQTK
ncbi:MAG: GspH/FimT family pseudopilin [Deltaproteobacteria bacterium]|nr:GspH/FimT family pseudopilin [Deltaproteobacteria bacterium]